MTTGRRSAYQGSRLPFNPVDGVRTGSTLELGIYKAPEGAGAPRSFDSYELEEEFDYFIVEQEGAIDNEAHQTIITGDGEKIMFFDRILPVLSISGFVYDHAEDRLDPAGGLIPGNGYSKWRSFYDKARLSQIAGTNRVVRVALSGMVWYGALTSSSASHGSVDPYRVAISTGVMVMSGSPVGDLGIERLADPAVYGYLSDESADSLGLATSRAPAAPSPDATTVGASAVSGTVSGKVGTPFTGLPGVL